MASHQVLHEGDDAPDFFVTGDPAEHISKWIDEITTHMENNFRVVGAFGDRDFIGGPPILVQITEFIDTCKRTIVVFDGRSRWANYAAQMVIHRMFQENAEKCNERLIIVLRNKEAAKQVPTFLRNNHTLNADAKDFYNKLFYSVKGYSSKERYNLNKQNEILPKQETENPGACLLELLPPQDELYLPPEPNSDKPGKRGKFYHDLDFCPCTGDKRSKLSVISLFHLYLSLL
ncbi:uncharacterized protein LOC100368451 [Saccoglossus kowalevskii]|uniref:Uncharacterized protein LOC100368451 n=1 Tax=Saccoglossus kowalevskii TaxID=10224 RepID=A0ABM0MXM5_SACKO|nr:PREDICTED: uncharacterized protein LOC100368451 [Saccoglossus kowalevskii]